MPIYPHAGSWSTLPVCQKSTYLLGFLYSLHFSSLTYWVAVNGCVCGCMNPKHNNYMLFIKLQIGNKYRYLTYILAWPTSEDEFTLVFQVEEDTKSDRSLMWLCDTSSLECPCHNILCSVFLLKSAYCLKWYFNCPRHGWLCCGCYCTHSDVKPAEAFIVDVHVSAPHAGTICACQVWCMGKWTCKCSN